ncbi:MAG: hypothetical protein ABI218_11760 [Caldimonas sp.]
MLGGELVFHFINVMVMTVLIAPLVLWRYKRAVLAGMQSRGGATLPIAPAQAWRPAPADVSPAPALAWEARIRRRVFAASLGALVLPSFLLAAQYLALGGEPIAPAALWMVGGVACTMAVPIFAVLTATPFLRAFVLWVALLVAFAVTGLLIAVLQRVAAGKMPTLDQANNLVLFFQYAAYTLALPLLFGLVIGARRVRGIAPLAFAGLLVFATGPLLGLHLTKWLGDTSWAQGWLLSGPGLDAGFVVLALPVGALAWWRLKALARGYEAKRFSDAQLLAHSWWLLFVATRAVELVSVWPGTRPLLEIAAVSVLAYALVPFTLSRLLRRAYSGTARPAPRTLLLLRVFGDTARTESLFDRIASRWQLFGPVTMIAAPDVVARVVDPGDMLRFFTGNLRASFVQSHDDLARRFATLDVAPDGDGRYRVSEFCCRDDTWQATIVALIVRADAVVMDLRGFTAARHGCEFELRELAARLDPRRVVLVVDASTDRVLLEDVAAPERSGMRVVEVRRGNARETALAFEALLRAAA